MTRPPLILQVVGWVALWIFFTIATRMFHPTSLIAVSVTGCLELAAAGAFYLNEFWLVPRFLVVNRFFGYAAALFVAVLGITVAVVFLIQLLYDILWMPDPRRLTLKTNIETDFAWISVHVLLGAGVFRLWKHWARRAASR